MPLLNLSSIDKAFGPQIILEGASLRLETKENAALIGANYGSNLSLFPSTTKDFYGLKNFGVNYGLVFTAWGVGGFMLALLAGKVYDATQSFNFAYYCSAGLLVAAAGVTYIVKQPHHQLEPSGFQAPLAAEPVRAGAYAKVPVPTRRKGPR